MLNKRIKKNIRETKASSSLNVSLRLRVPVIPSWSGCFMFYSADVYVNLLPAKQSKHTVFFPLNYRLQLLQNSRLSFCLSLITQYNHIIELVLKMVIYAILTLLVILLSLSVFYGSRLEDSNTPSFTYLFQTCF